MEAEEAVEKQPLMRKNEGAQSQSGHQTFEDARQEAEEAAEKQPLMRKSETTQSRKSHQNFEDARQEAPMASVSIDVDRDGRPDVVVTGVDQNRDGIPDALQAEEAGEQQPLLRRSESSQSRTGHQTFEDARQEAAQQAAMEAGWFTWVLLAILCFVFLFWFYVNLRSWYVLFQYYGDPCDQPLGDWLAVKLIIDFASSTVKQRQRSGDPPQRISMLILLLQNIWLIIGFEWCSKSKTCATTNPELYSWVRFLLVFGAIVTILLMLLPVVFYVLVNVMVHLIGTGRIKNNRAARDDTLSLLESVKYSPDMFADSSDPKDNRPSGECCCCTETFDGEQAILRTPCDHYFHEACLGEWLKLSKTCPICRCDLDAATEAMLKPKEVDIDSCGEMERGEVAVTREASQGSTLTGARTSLTSDRTRLSLTSGSSGASSSAPQDPQVDAHSSAGASSSSPPDPQVDAHSGAGASSSAAQSPQVGS